MSTRQQQLQPGAQLPGESGPAYEAFRIFLELGGGRTVAEVVRRLRKKSLIWRWVSRHDWRHRAWLYDRHQTRQEEAVVREHQEERLRERLEDVDRVGRACLAFFRTLIHRDPETGEISFDARFTPQVALRFLELALKAQGAFDKSTPDEKSEDRPAADLFGLADAELAELIDLARERADQQSHKEEDGDESDQSSTDEEKDEQHQYPADEEREQEETSRD